ncbi:hypothetical protein [Streptococcus pneumoniae]|uniref:hypothetical protein n=1 Tax=Streptococcus pneumoniae TaxID=1313 RepID=UPI000A9D36BE|nr:hypothetical protein [Streptococcus pneumoniae]
MSTDETLYTLRKSLQTSSASPCRMYGLTVKFIHNLKAVLSQPATSFLVCL